MDELDTQVARHLANGAWNEAVELVVTKLGPKLRAFVAAAMGDAAQADDVWSDVLLDLYRGIGTWGGRASLEAWCWRIVRNACHRAWQARQREGRRRGLLARFASRPSFLFGRREDTPPWKTTPVRNLVQRLRDELPSDDRLLLLLRIERRLSWDEVAEAFRGPGDKTASARQTAALRKRFERIVARLARRARDEGVGS